MTAERLYELGLIDEVIAEPLGGAHRNPKKMAKTLKAHLKTQLTPLEAIPLDELIEKRYEHWLSFGKAKSS